MIEYFSASVPVLFCVLLLGIANGVDANQRPEYNPLADKGLPKASAQQRRRLVNGISDRLAVQRASVGLGINTDTYEIGIDYGTSADAYRRPGDKLELLLDYAYYRSQNYHRSWRSLHGRNY